ncbi:MAG TPA: hypothetical protein VFK52_04720 [Nocardioidaceae bacterium]|nr:hypothetical protein [Nocardioidaceae bacterium]
MADPVELLESFPRALAGDAPDPDDLRRRGDRRRNRRRAAGAAGAAVLVAIAAVAAPLALGGNGESTTPPVRQPDSSLGGEIPPGFPLMVGLPQWAAVSSQSTGPLAFEACGRELTDAPSPVDIMQVAAQRDGVTFERQAMTFADPASAAAWVDTVTALYDGCPRDFAQDGDPPDLLYVVGRAVLVARYATVDGSPEELPETDHAAMAEPVVEALGRTWIGFGGEQGVFVESADEATTELAGASDDFRAFVGGLVTDLQAMADCADAAVGVTVEHVVDDRWAFGGVHQCGGYRALWGRDDQGRWVELLGSQEMWLCSELDDAGVPRSVAGPCYTLPDSSR